MSALVDELVQAYREQAQAYDEALALAKESVAVAQAGEPLLRLHELNLRKRAALAKVEAIDRAIQGQKLAWRCSERGGQEGAELQRLLATITDVIEEILVCERATDRWIVEGAGELASATVPSPSGSEGA